MADNNEKYPYTIAGLYNNKYGGDNLNLRSAALTQQRADEMCDAIQKCVGGILEVREWGGVSKTGKDLPEFKLSGVTAAQVAERKAFGEQKKLERGDIMTTGDGGL